MSTPITVSQDQIDSAILNTYHTDTFGAVLSGTGDFTNTFDFLLDAASIANGQLSTIDLSGVGVDFTHIFLDGAEQSLVNSQKWILDPVELAATGHSIVVQGTVGSGGSGSYSGNFNITNSGGVPEPATWAMMLLGFGGIGYSMRRRRRTSLLQLA